ncbi:MAG: MTH1187 family thiamine-binding protein [Desulfobaccales bacterium]
MAIMEINVVPLGLGQTSLGDHIAALVKYLENKNIPYELTDMGTLVHGQPEMLLQVAQALHELPFQQGVKRVLTHISMDDRRDQEVSLGDKKKSVRVRLKSR